MPVRLLSPLSLNLSARLLQTRARRAAVGIVIAVSIVTAYGFHVLVAIVGVTPSATTSLVYNALVLVGYGLVFALFSRHLQRIRFTPLRVFWWSLLAGVMTACLWFSLFYLLDEEAGFRFSEAGLPDSIRTASKVHFLSGLEAIFAFVLILQLRVLVLYRRSRASVRNWYVMLGLMAAASITMWGASPLESYSVWTQILTIMAVVAMVVNSLRLSWIVFLSFRQKAAIILLCIALAGLLGFGLAEDSTGIFVMRNVAPFARVHSYALNTFVMLSLVFAMMYSITSFLSMLFHLPTTSDFRKKAGELAAIHSVSRLTSDIFNQDSLFQAITASPVEAATAHSSWLAVTDPRTGSLRPRIVCAHNVDQSKVEEMIDLESLYDDAAQRNVPLLLNHASADHRVRARPGSGFGSLLVVPLVFRSEVLGALFVTKEVSNGFEQEDIDTTCAFADQAALALDNARLFAERLEKERMAHELEIAQQVQRKLLPQGVPEIKGARLAASSVSALEVGGDYYDFVRIDEYRYGIIVGDVSGKGTSAAIYMAELKGIFQSLGRISTSPSTFLLHANSALVESMERNSFVSAVYAVLDLEAEAITVARAGHPPIILSRKDGGAHFVRTHGLGLGLDRGSLFGRTLHEERIALEPGDTFVLYTDGVVESRVPGESEYGYSRLMKTVCDNRALDADPLHAAILEDLHAYLGPNRYTDDMTLVVLKWHGSARRDAADQTTQRADGRQPVEANAANVGVPAVPSSKS